MPVQIISEKAAQRIQECREKKLPYLNLSNCGLRDIPNEIFEFYWVKSLNLGNVDLINSNNESNSDNEPNHYNVLNSFPNLRSLEVLFLNNCGLKDLKFLSSLTKLQELYTNGNEITDINPLLSILVENKIRIIDLSKNPIRDLSPFSGRGYNSKLKELNLEKTNIQEIASISHFYSLEKLNIDANIPNLNITALSDFHKLTDLRISALRIESNSLFFDGLKALQKLYLVYEEGDASFVSKIESLNNLTLRSKQFKGLSGFEKLSNLTELNLANCLITDITSISNLENLETLDLESNEIRDITPLITLKKLNSINLSNNKISSIKPLLKIEKSVKIISNLLKLIVEFGNQLPTVTSDIALRINNNPVEDFPLIRLTSVKSLQDIINYYADDIHKRTIANNEIKLILVGNSAVGKTNLTNILRGGKFNDKQNTTHGVLVNRHKIGKLFLNFWDFGGQEYYHGTHRLFFSSNAIYVLLWNKKTNGYEKKLTKVSRKEIQKDELIEHFHYSYWLDTIRAFVPINETKCDDILIVQTYIDELGNEKQNISPEIIDQFKISADYSLSLKPAQSGIKRFKFGFESFKEELLEMAAKRIEDDFLTPIENDIRNWFAELSYPKSPPNPLSIISKNDCFLNFDEFVNVCINHFKNIVLTRSQLETLVGTLHDAGLVLYYRNNAILRQKIYFAPQLITAMMYDVLDEDIVLKNNGAFTLEHTNKMLKNNVELARDLERLMIEFGVILPFPNKNEYTNFITPQYLPEKHDVSDIFSIATAGFGEKEITLKLPIFYYRNAMMHLLSLYATASSGRIFWKNGILFTQNDARIFIRGELNTITKETNEATITIAVAANSEGNQREKQIEILREIFKSMNQQSRISGYDYVLSSYDFLDEFKEKLSVALGNNKTDFVPIFELKKQANTGLIMTFWNNKRQNIRSFDVVLEAINVKKPIPSVFVSYSRSDIEECKELLTYLGVIERKQGIKVWTDGDINAGSEWKTEIKEQLNSADVIVLLVSANFLKSNFIYDNELMPALQKIKDDATKRVIPVLIRTTPQLPELWELQFLPRNEFQRLQAVNSWNYKDDAWTQIAEAIGKAFE